MIEKNEKVCVRGLKDVAAAETRISFVQPLGALFYAGYNIDKLIEHVCYEEVVHLLIHGDLPNQKQLDRLKNTLRNEMNLHEDIVNSIRSAPKRAHPMEILRTEVSHLGEYDPDPNDESEVANKRRALKLIAKVPAIVACIQRIKTKQEPYEPQEKYDLPENFLFMFGDDSISAREKDAMNRYMILHADHGLNASTFSARVTASTFSDMYSAVTSAIGTLKGRLHGGASERVMHMLIEVPTIDEVEEYIQGMLLNKQRVMGFGHRIYLGEDPRSKHLKKISKALCKTEQRLDLYEKCKKIQGVVHKEKKIYPNVDFYAALVLNALGVPTEFFTPFFAASRISGWTAHILEQYTDAVLIRPTSNYIGVYEREFVPLENR